MRSMNAVLATAFDECFATMVPAEVRVLDLSVEDYDSIRPVMRICSRRRFRGIRSPGAPAKTNTAGGLCGALAFSFERAHLSPRGAHPRIRRVGRKDLLVASGAFDGKRIIPPLRRRHSGTCLSGHTCCHAATPAGTDEPGHLTVCPSQRAGGWCKHPACLVYPIDIALSFRGHCPSRA